MSDPHYVILHVMNEVQRKMGHTWVTEDVSNVESICGVPQGSNLGPLLLFPFHINDMVFKNKR